MVDPEHIISDHAATELAGRGLRAISLFRGGSGRRNVALCSETGGVQPVRAAVIEGNTVLTLFPPPPYNRVAWADNHSLLVDRYIPVLRTVEGSDESLLEFAVLDVDNLEDQVLYRTEYALWKLIVDGPALRAGVEQKSYYGSDAHVFEFHTGRMLRVWGTNEADVFETFDGEGREERTSDAPNTLGRTFFDELTAMIHFQPRDDDEDFWTYGWWKAKLP